jgi:hypothetical protein
MARHLARSRSHVGLLVSLIAAACSAPVDEGEDTVPEFRGVLPTVAGANTPIAQNSGANPPAGSGVSSPNGEAIGSNPGSVPVDNTGANGAGAVPGSNTSGTGGASGAGAPGSGAGGSAMSGTAGAPSTGAGGSGSPVGAGGSAMAGTAGGGTVPPGNTPPPQPPPPPSTPPPAAGAGCEAGAIFCEDFEGINVGALTGTVEGLRVDRAAEIFAEPGRGRVLRVQAGTGYGNKGGVFIDNFAPPNNSFFGRAFIRVAQFPTAGGDHWVLVEATANDAGERVRPVGGQFSRWAPGSDGASAGDWTDWEQSDAATTGGAWECVEWQINGANGGNDMLLWVNGLEVQPVDRGNFRLPTINTVWLGFVVFQNGQPPNYDVRFDDVVFSTERIGCD